MNKILLLILSFVIFLLILICLCKKKYNNECLKFKKESKEILENFHNILSKNNVPYIIAYGTLIGAARDKDFISYDKDIDVIILEEDVEKYKKLKSQFYEKGLGFFTGEDFLFRVYLNKYNTYGREIQNTHELENMKFESYLDVFIYKKVDGNKYIDRNEGNRKMWPNCYIYQDEYYPIKPITIAGLTVYGPNKVDEILTRWYGNWKTPDGDTMKGMFEKITKF